MPVVELVLMGFGLLSLPLELSLLLLLFSLPEVAALSLPLPLSLWLSEEATEEALGVVDDGFVRAEPLGTFLGCLRGSFASVDVDFGAVSTLLSDSVLSSSASVSSTYSVLSIDGFAVFLGRFILAASTASLSFFKDDILEDANCLGVCFKFFPHA